MTANRTSWYRAPLLWARSLLIWVSSSLEPYSFPAPWSFSKLYSPPAVTSPHPHFWPALCSFLSHATFQSYALPKPKLWIKCNSNGVQRVVYGFPYGFPFQTGEGRFKCVSSVRQRYARNSSILSSWRAQNSLGHQTSREFKVKALALNFVEDFVAHCCDFLTSCSAWYF